MQKLILVRQNDIAQREYILVNVLVLQMTLEVRLSGEFYYCRNTRVQGPRHA